MTDARDIVERIAPLLEELETGQECAEYAYAKGKGFEAMTYCPEAFEALKELPDYIASLRKQLEDAPQPYEYMSKQDFKALPYKMRSFIDAHKTWLAKAEALKGKS